MLDLATQKAQELAFALIKVAGYIRRTELRQRIEKLSYHLLETIVYKDVVIAATTITALRNFVLLGKNLYEIEPNNARILDRELEQLEIEVSRHTGTTQTLDVNSFFSVRLPVKNKDKEKKQPVHVGHPEMPEEIVVDETEIGSDKIEDNSVGAMDYPASDREEKILAMIAATGNGKMQLRDFIAAFPDLSERTIRYDLKRLADSGKIERQGSGGPSNYYVLKSSERDPSASG